MTYVKSTRRIAREIAVQSLFQIDFNPGDPLLALAAALAEQEEEMANKVCEYAQALLLGVMANKEAIDARLNQFAIDWKVERMPATDRNILRVAVYEIYYAATALEAGIAINEAVELAKTFGTDESPRFINGLLGKMVKA